MYQTRSHAVMQDKSNVLRVKANTLSRKASQYMSNKNESFHKMNLRRNANKENSSLKKFTKIKCIPNDLNKENTNIPVATSFVKHQIKSKQQNSNKVKNTKIDSYSQKKLECGNEVNTPQSIPYYPIWKRYVEGNNLPVSKQIKRVRERDIYDISQDEQLMTENVPTKKKVRKMPSKIPSKIMKSKTFVRKEKPLIQNKIKHSVKQKCISSTEKEVINIKPVSEGKHGTEIIGSGGASQSKCETQLNKRCSKISHSIGDKSKCELKNFEIVHDQTCLENLIQDVIICHSTPKATGNDDNEGCCTDFEKSLLPQMTSTPDSEDRPRNNMCISSTEKEVINIKPVSEGKHGTEIIGSGGASQSKCETELNKKCSKISHSIGDKSKCELKNFEIVRDQTCLENRIQDVIICHSTPKATGNDDNEGYCTDFEKSLLPQMTSTPDSEDRPCNNMQPNTKLSEMSSIMCSESQCMNGVLLLTPESLPDQIESHTEICDIPEIILFESPVKEEPKKKTNLPTSTVVKLFEEDPCVSPVKENLKESVLKPKKAYHTPEQFRKHIYRSKKIGHQKKKTAAQIKEEKLIKEMNKHFSDVESFEFCIE